jgi:hypothetical protein
MLRLRMSGAIPLLPLYAFMAWTGTLPFYTSYVKYAYCELDVLTHWHLLDFVYSKYIKVKFSCA